MLVGESVGICNLASRPDLNGQQGRIVGWDATSGQRWIVAVENTGETIKIKQINLRIGLPMTVALLDALPADPDPMDPRWAIFMMIQQIGHKSHNALSLPDEDEMSVMGGSLGGVPVGTYLGESNREKALVALAALVDRYGWQGDVVNGITPLGSPLVHAVSLGAGARANGQGYDEASDIWATRMVRCLLEAPAIDINLKASLQGPAGAVTPLFCAAWFGLAHVTRALLESPVIDPAIPCLALGRRALGCAAMYSGRDYQGQPCAALTNFVEVTKAIVEHPRCDPAMVETPATKVEGKWLPDMTAFHLATSGEAVAVIKNEIAKRARVQRATSVA